MSHSLKMLLGCLVPLLVIFTLPAFGVSSDATTLVFIVLMFGCHLFMMKGHGGGHEHGHQTTRKGGPHEPA